MSSRLAARFLEIRNRDPKAQHAIFGISIVDLSTGATLYSENADKLLQPASNTKLFTTASALALIGPDYKFSTTVESEHPPDKLGRLTGDLVLVGRGDPNLSGRVLPYSKKTERVTPHTRVLQELADQVAAAGVKVVDGDIVGDDSFFLHEAYGEGWTQDDLMWDYGAPVSALTVNDNVVFASLKPGEHVGDRAVLTLDPYTHYYTVRNLVATSARGSTKNVGILREPGSMEITFWGSLPLGDAGDDEALAIEDPAVANAQLLRELLEQHGIIIHGKVRARHAEVWEYPPPASGQPIVAAQLPEPKRTVLAANESLALVEDLKVINKVSQNLHVEMLLRLIGRLRGTSSSFSGGLAAEKKFLTEQVKIDPTELDLFDGSGLSRSGLTTPQAITELLYFASRQQWAAQFRDTLPLAAEDGSLSLRFKGTLGADRVQAKTGSLGEVAALSGYATARSGKQIAFSIVINHHNMGGANSRQMIDDMVNAALEED